MNYEQILNSEEFRKVIDFHGHICPGVAIGFRAAKIGLDWLAEARSEDEEIVAIVENDACGVDAVQALTGCTFGKGNFIFRDYGKQVFVFLSRNSGKAIRVSLKPDALTGEKVDTAVFNRVMNGEASEEDTRIFHDARMKKLKKILEMPAEELFAAKEINMRLPPRATVMSSEPCSRCGEPAMPSKMESVDEKKICRECLDMV